MTDRLLPSPQGPAAEWYRWCAKGELRFQRCDACGRWRHPPRVLCAGCASTASTWVPSSAEGAVFSWTVTHRALHPAFEAPFAVVVVELAEGVRVVCGLDGDASALALDMPVTIEVEPVNDDIGLLRAVPMREAPGSP